MIFKGLKENNGWMMAEYCATWKYGYDFMLDAAQTVIDTDFHEKLQRFDEFRQIVTLKCTLFMRKDLYVIC